MGVGTYLGVYSGLIILVTVQLLVFSSQLEPTLKAISIVGIAGIQASLISFFYQHLRYEPSSIRWMIGLGLIASLIFLVLSIFSIRVFFS